MRLVRGRAGLEQLTVAALVLAAVLASLTWAILLPFDHAPDEFLHFTLAQWIAAHAALPVYDQSPGLTRTQCFGRSGPCIGSYASVPLGAPMLSAAFMAAYHLLTGAPTDRLFFVARLASALCVGGWVVALYLLAREVVADRAVRLTVVVIGALIPQVAFVGGYTNDDALSLLTATLALYFAARMVNRPLGVTGWLLAGAAAGLVLLSRLNGYAVLPVLAVAGLYRLGLELRAGRRGRAVLEAGLGAVAALAVGGWSLARNYAVYHDAFGAGVIYRAFYRLAPDYRLSTLSGQGYSFRDLLLRTDFGWTNFRTFWGVFDYEVLPLPAGVYNVLYLLTFVALAGLLVALVRAPARRRLTREVAIVAALFTAVTVVVAGLSAWNSLYNNYQPQGRYLYPALAPIALGLAVGLHGFLGHPLYRRFVLAATVVFMAWLSAFSLVLVAAPVYRAWPQ